MKNNYWIKNMPKKDWMRRIFLPVGRGAFYCENFMIDGLSEPINVVFDCGVIPPADTAARLGNVIKTAFGEHKVIHAVFLSCLQSAHINGLKILHDTYHIEIERIYYPEIAEGNQGSMELWYKLTEQQNTLAWNYCHKGTECFLGDRLRPIRHPSSNYCPLARMARTDEKVEVENGAPLHDGQEISLAEIAGGSLGSRITNSPFADWVFYANNFCFHDLPLKTSLFFRVLKNQDTDRRNFLKKNMQPYFNTNSLVVYSGPQPSRSKLVQRIYDPDEQHGFQLNASPQYAPGCLYTGDIDDSTTPAWSELTKVYQPYGQYIGCLQLSGGGGGIQVEKWLSSLRRRLDELILVSSTESSDSSLLCNAKMNCITDEEETCLCTIVS